ncbi:SIMPL domain-containing protein [Anaerocolumna sp. AGMB13025]|uniref:SIMPL domain-containing protein n=1 Tax=Anaerocolumna sp. AGMB13025 TaxID=3039116 RepID=UPI0024203322|nr:SIMPL domain-containing protein [Anaerocolumna sp. AGMB13025]WFR58775.1 SIMPL domain-containing protein [Anaerocolumna sp. AGMB13025]
MSRYNYDGTYDEKTMTLTGQGQVTAIPDIAVIRLGVETAGDNLMTIQSENAQISQAVIDSIKSLGISDIKTYRYSIDKRYDYVNGTQIDRGYVVQNIVEIRLTDMEQVGRVIDTAVSYGANTVDFISFEVSDLKLYYQQALNQAVLSAIQKAESLAMLLGVPLDPVPLHIEENSTPPIPFSRSSFAREGAFATPIEPGNKLIEAFVTVRFSY